MHLYLSATDHTVIYKLLVNNLVVNNLNDVIFELSAIDFTIGMTAINNTKTIIVADSNTNNMYNRIIADSYFSQNHAMLFQHRGSLIITNTTFVNNNGSTLDYTIINNETSPSLEISIIDSKFLDYNIKQANNTIFSITRDVCVDPNGFVTVLSPHSTNTTCSQSDYSEERQGCDDPVCEQFV